MERNTKHYQSDFELDVKSMRRIAQINHCEQTPLYWMSRPSGTWLLRERDLFIRESSAFHIWQYYKDTQDYRAMAEYLEKNALPAASARVLFEGHLAPMTFTYEDYQSNRPALQAKHGKEIKLWLEPSDPAVLDTILKNADRRRQNFIPGVFENHLDKMIAAEKHSITRFLKKAAVNSPQPAQNEKRKELPLR